MTNKDFIRKFNEITVTNICRELGISPQNVFSGRADRHDISLVKQILEYKLKSLLLVDEYYVSIKEYDERRLEVLEND